MIKEKKILVIGGAGFIGSHLVKQLLQKKAIVVVVDIHRDPFSFFAKEKLKKRVTYKNIDIRDKEKVLQLFAKYAPDYVFHLAAEPIVSNSYSDPISTFETNIMGTVYILEAAKITPSVKCLIVASSDKAYGKTTKAYNEESPLQGDHPYDVSKSSADLITQAYYKTYKLPVVITRFGNVYGEGDVHLDRIIPGICEAILKKTPLLIRSDGTYVRDYLYVRDVVDGYIFLLKNMEKTIGQAYNFSSEDSLSVLKLIREVERILQKKIDYEIKNTAQNEIPYQHLNDTKIRKLGWKSRYSLEEGIKITYQWYKKFLFF